MGLVTQTITFSTGSIPSATDWTNQFSTLYNLVNGQLDSANVDKTSADGIMVLDTAQTRTAALTLTGTLTVNAAAVFNDGAGDFDFRLETQNISNGFLSDAALNVFAFGGAAVDDAFLNIVPPAATHTATQNVYNQWVHSSGAQTIPAGTTAVVASARFDEPNITATGIVTDAATVYISGAPTEGTTSNHSLNVAAGSVNFGGAADFLGTWEAPVRIGTLRLWYDATNGALRVKHGSDGSSETDGYILLEG